MSAAALAGFALSGAVNLISLLGFYSRPILSFQIDLVFGMFFVSLFAGLAQERLMCQFSFRDRLRTMNPKLASKVRRRLSSPAPKWLRRLFWGAMVYTFILFGLFIYGTLSATPSDLDEVRVMSAFAAVFYSGAAMVLTAYARSDHPLNPAEFGNDADRASA
ncbi:MAG: hypothetical protein WA854_04035 [Candidatus Binataceae bacterium]